MGDDCWLLLCYYMRLDATPNSKGQTAHYAAKPTTREHELVSQSSCVNYWPYKCEANVLLISYIVLINLWIIISSHKPRSLRDKTSIVHLLHVTAPKRGAVVVYALAVSYALRNTPFYVHLATMVLGPVSVMVSRREDTATGSRACDNTMVDNLGG